MSKIFIIIGILLIIVGLAIQLKIPIGRLPGDFSYHRDNFHFYFPLTTCIILSVLLTILLMLFTKK
ncbi:MAG: DUF2905 domain-containing protein [Candidatus Omnitrophica bacterium]|nr:DUF2905 domain-containing protein [Candidatus Omnitrophota bacterium]